ncbi:armadillo-type protein [Mycena maculata]|uniref:Armadillo-type protein n=1 Tax=Mycena maculata TaxID=230809 RepID=A0AAD7JNH2_9AGAR|nr:armadillo-type protein [Mycena maculata]
MSIWAGIEARVLGNAVELLGCLNSEVRRWTCRIIRHLANDASTVLAFLEFNPCKHLITLVRDENAEVVREAKYALFQIAENLQGLQAVFDDQAADHILELLRLPDSEVRKWTCSLVGKLAIHHSAWRSKLCSGLVTLLRDEDTGVIFEATYALSWVAETIQGALTVVEAKALNHVLEMLRSSDGKVQGSTCSLLGNLAVHEEIFPAILELNPFLQLSSLLLLLPSESGGDVKIIAARTLCLLVDCLDAHTALGAKVFDNITESLELTTPDLSLFTCWLVGRMVSPNSCVLRSGELKLCEYLVSCVREEQVVLNAIYALVQVARCSSARHAVIDAKALDHIVDILGSPNAEVRRWSCMLVVCLASRKSTAPAILELNPCVQLVALLRDLDLRVVHYATCALSHISASVQGARLVFDARAPEDVLQLLESPSADIRGWTCVLLGNLALDEGICLDILRLHPCARLVSILREEDGEIIEWPTFALSRIAHSPDGALAVMEAGILDHVLELLESADAGVRRRASSVVRFLAYHDATAPAIFALKPWRKLLPLLHDINAATRGNAILALDQIMTWWEGVAALEEIGAVEALQQLDEAADATIAAAIRSIHRSMAHYWELATDESS